jgi:hypothetical protein
VRDVQVYLEAYTSILGVDTDKLVRKRDTTHRRQKAQAAAAFRAPARRAALRCAALRAAAPWHARTAGANLRCLPPTTRAGRRSRTRCATVTAHSAPLACVRASSSQEALYGKKVELLDREYVEQARARHDSVAAASVPQWAACAALTPRTTDPMPCAAAAGH